MKEPAIAITRMERSGIGEIFDLANTIPDAIHLEMGEPGFQTPEHIREAAAKAAEDGYTKVHAECRDPRAAGSSGIQGAQKERHRRELRPSDHHPWSNRGAVYRPN